MAWLRIGWQLSVGVLLPLLVGAVEYHADARYSFAKDLNNPVAPGADETFTIVAYDQYSRRLNKGGATWDITLMDQSGYDVARYARVDDVGTGMYTVGYGAPYEEGTFTLLIEDSYGFTLSGFPVSLEVASASPPSRLPTPAPVLTQPPPTSSAVTSPNTVEPEEQLVLGLHTPVLVIAAIALGCGSCVCLTWLNKLARRRRYKKVVQGGGQRGLNQY
mmetsp:Transcript_6978/g.7814  ORF Transcript_6978/g.7814 Transcript_6978/m.7814 type:complete len:218 (-) Transcript_6978:248-901(-)